MQSCLVLVRGKHQGNDNDVDCSTRSQGTRRLAHLRMPTYQDDCREKTLLV